MSVRNEIKAQIIRAGYTMQEAVDLLHEEYGWSDSVSNLSAKLQRESIRYKEVMELLWREGRPLSRSEIIDLTPDRTWKPASIHILLNSMLEKGAIQVAGFVQSTKNYARTFTPTLTADEYAVLQFKHSSAFNEQSVLCLVSALVEDIQDQDTLAKLGDILEKRKLQLG